MDCSSDHIAEGTLGGFTARQLLRLCHVLRLDPAVAGRYADDLVGSLGSAARRPLSLPPASPSFVADDHTPVEFSLSFRSGADPVLRVLLEPGSAFGDLAENGRHGWRAVRAMARRWGHACDRLDALEDLFLPADPRGPFALWCALELGPGGAPKLKVYLNPSANGADRAAETVREALGALGRHEAFATLPAGDAYPFLALDLGHGPSSRVKVYIKHDDLTAGEAGGLPRMEPGPPRETLTEFLRVAAGHGTGVLGVVGCHSFTEMTTARPSGFTLHLPIRTCVRHDGEAYARTVSVLERHGMDPEPLTRSLAALTARRPEDGSGLIAYLALVHEKARPPRVTAYLSCEAYGVQPPRYP
ncbi:tryptophan dimethylallyltransferase family protein [Actinomadura sp. DC4]|uniref:tryptophan dimethylallyltransferase family protein n=1 Tax=Actinomadura sp. DC4 TaxID=3055069 RepID=UPI0025B0410E|nr:tryptophan dimethylallyltransferase family protein [Actinomadura sp. DC4]MDN3357900.1 tryptophan dimethylallyltransferase family protein [Actinomadura sp. DC4]